MKIVNIDLYNHFDELIELELKLWPDHLYDELYQDTKNLIDNNNFYLRAIINNKLIGFIQLSIRYEYVNGSTTSPVGYIEGIFVEDEFRKQGIGTELVKMSFAFFRKRNLQEIISDVEIDNYLSQKFHEKVGFKETERVIYYRHKL